MDEIIRQKEILFAQMRKLQARYELSKTVGPNYYEPGMMEYLDRSRGTFDEATGRMVLCYEAKGTRYDGRTSIIENMHEGDMITVVRDEENPYNHNNFTMVNGRGQNVGHMPAELCNAIAPLYDAGYIEFQKAFASYVEPISVRSRYAKQAMLFVQLELQVYDEARTMSDEVKAESVISETDNGGPTETPGENALRDANDVWIVSCNPNYYDVEGAFRDLPVVTWRQKFTAKSGDTVLIYVSGDIKAIRYQCRVEEADLSSVRVDDSAYYKNDFDKNNVAARWMELKLIRIFVPQDTKMSVLAQYGVRGAIMGPRHAPPELVKYLDTLS